MAAFEGMLASATIWATDAYHTTDRTELVHARVVANQELERESVGDQRTEVGRQAAIEIIKMIFDKGVLSPALSNVFIASFSAAKDLKSQWVGYGDRMEGFSVAFDLRHIRPPEVLESGVTLAPCLYKEEAKVALINAALEKLRSRMSETYGLAANLSWVAAQLHGWKMIDAMSGERFSRPEFEANMETMFREMVNPTVFRTTFDLLRVAGHCKNPAYFEENEWRLVLPHMKGRPLVYTTVQYRDRGDMKEIPYVAHRIGGIDRLPIVSVMTGPKCNRVDEVHSVLARHGYRVPVVPSQVPER